MVPHARLDLRSVKKLLAAYPVLAFVAPFAIFVLALSLKNIVPFGLNWLYPIQVVLASAAVLLTVRHVGLASPVRPLGSLVIGILVFVVWIGPDLIWPSYRNHWLFENSLTGEARSSLPTELRSDAIFLIFRLFGTAILVPVIEEIFWRGWLMRYIIDGDFLKVPLGTYSGKSYWFTAILFATEHGPFWDVGFIAGLIFNWWMLRTRSLSDCMIAHGVTNLSLALFVILDGQWQYWL